MINNFQIALFPDYYLYILILFIHQSGVNGWFAVNLPSVGWSAQGDQGTALDQV